MVNKSFSYSNYNSKNSNNSNKYKLTLNSSNYNTILSDKENI